MFLQYRRNINYRGLNFVVFTRSYLLIHLLPRSRYVTSSYIVIFITLSLHESLSNHSFINATFEVFINVTHFIRSNFFHVRHIKIDRFYRF